MQALNTFRASNLIIRRSLPRTALPQRTLQQQPSHPFRRTYAEVNQRGSGGEPSGPTSNLPLIVGVGGVAFIFLYYLAQGFTGGAREGDRPPGSGQAAIKESRRQGDPSNETRDPRDSGVKTSTQDKVAKEAAAKK